MSERSVAVAAQLIDHRLRLVFASDIINADIGPGMPERERDGSANARAGAGDNRFLAFEQFTIFGFRNNRLWQIHEILRMRHFRFRTISCFGWHGWHKICWFSDSSSRFAIPYKALRFRSV